MPPIHHSSERNAYNPNRALEQILERDERQLELLAMPGRVLTPERLAHHKMDAEQIVAYAEQNDISWPSRETAVPPHVGSHIRHYFVPNAAQADAHFLFEAMAGRRQEGDTRRGFNNFPAILRSLPFRPASAADVQEAMARDPAGAVYGCKPYLLRAHMVAPEFMGALREAVDVCEGTAGWTDALIRGGLEADVYPEDAALLRSSRLAYGLLTNLMRTDDLQRQSRWFRAGETSLLIDNPEVELWT